MNNQSFENVYFVGAGGIGMAALERYFLSRRLRVGGYDHTPSHLTAALEAEGVEMTFDDAAEAIAKPFRDPAKTLVVYTPAVPATHPGLTWFRDNGFRVIKRSKALGIITDAYKSLCFAGTHGKTTTSCMAAHLLEVSGRGSNAFLGGILRNYGSNLLLSATSPWAVAEADEFDRSFHQLKPWVAVITSTDPDHLDIYHTEEAYLESFTKFSSLIRPGGTLLMHTGLKFKPAPGEDVSVMTYSRDAGDYHAANIRRSEGAITFDLVGPAGTVIVSDIALGVPVEVNIENAIAALGAIDIAGELDPDSARRAMASFMGAERRFEFRLNRPGRVVIDDYAHHPRELRASIESVRALYPSRRLSVAFQPHLYTRTRDFAPDFARALSLADDVVILDIYPAREQPIEGVTSDLIFNDVTAPRKLKATRENLADVVKNLNFEVLLVLGAGNITDSIPSIISKLDVENQ